MHEFARLIGTAENIGPATMEILEAAAVVHDIAIKTCLEKCGECSGKLQEQEGPALAEALLNLSFSRQVTGRVSYLVDHHHTYTNIDGIDYQILVEADFLVNLHEHKDNKETIEKVYNKIFKTETGRKLCYTMFLK